MNGALRMDFNYCSVEVGIGHALNWNETHFFPSAGAGDNWRVKGETGYCILIEPSSGAKFSHNCAKMMQKQWDVKALRGVTCLKRTRLVSPCSSFPRKRGISFLLSNSWHKYDICINQRPGGFFSLDCGNFL